MKCQRKAVGTILVEEDKLDLAKDILAKASAKKVEFLLPVDHLCAKEFKAEAPDTTADSIPADMMGLDIGPKSVELFSKAIKSAKTVVWNGPMGVFEKKAFATGTFAICKALAETKCVSIIGGGDSVSAVNKSGVADKMTHISTGGGASLECLEGKTLPGVAALSTK